MSTSHVDRETLKTKLPEVIALLKNISADDIEPFKNSDLLSKYPINETASKIDINTLIEKLNVFEYIERLKNVLLDSNINDADDLINKLNNFKVEETLSQIKVLDILPDLNIDQFLDDKPLLKKILPYLKNSEQFTLSNLLNDRELLELLLPHLYKMDYKNIYNRLVENYPNIKIIIDNISTFYNIFIDFLLTVFGIIDNTLVTEVLNMDFNNKNALYQFVDLCIRIGLDLINKTSVNPTSFKEIFDNNYFEKFQQSDEFKNFTKQFESDDSESVQNDIINNFSDLQKDIDQHKTEFMNFKDKIDDNTFQQLSNTQEKLDKLINNMNNTLKDRESQITMDEITSTMGGIFDVFQSVMTLQKTVNGGNY